MGMDRSPDGRRNMEVLHTKYRKGRAVTSHLTAQTKIDMICTLIRLGRQDKSKLAHFDKEGKHLAAQRNLVAHGYSAVDPGNPSPVVTFISYHARGKLTARTRSATPEIIEELARRIARFNVFLMDMYETALPGMKPSQSKPRKQASLTPSSQRRRLRTIAKRLPPPLGWSPEELEAAKQAEKAAKKK